MVLLIRCRLGAVQESDFVDGIVKLFGELLFASWNVELGKVQGDEVGPVHLRSLSVGVSFLDAMVY